MAQYFGKIDPTDLLKMCKTMFFFFFFAYLTKFQPQVMSSVQGLPNFTKLGELAQAQKP